MKKGEPGVSDNPFYFSHFLSQYKSSPTNTSFLFFLSFSFFPFFLSFLSFLSFFLFLSCLFVQIMLFGASLTLQKIMGP